MTFLNNSKKTVNLRYYKFTSHILFGSLYFYCRALQPIEFWTSIKISILNRVKAHFCKLKKTHAPLPKNAFFTLNCVYNFCFENLKNCFNWLWNSSMWINCNKTKVFSKGSPNNKLRKHGIKKRLTLLLILTWLPLKHIKGCLASYVHVVCLL